ncbi:MAG: fructosamine kinase family protein [Prolixibacteraceae bacterium]|nr:fructosamine kinase family protein [Prolixibacteraceae bacterium]
MGTGPLSKEIIRSIEIDFEKEIGPTLKIVKVVPVGGGCINQGFRIETVGDTYFLKLNTHAPADMFFREAESLLEFQKSENEFVVFPKPLLAKEIGHEPGYLLTDYMEPGGSGNDDEKLGRGIARLHQVSNDSFGFKNNNYCGSTIQDNSFKNDWPTFYIENRIGYLINLIKQTGVWNSSDQKISDRFLERVPELLPSGSKPSLIHGDLWSGNYMYSRKAPALIDPCASYCDREFEMGMMTMFGGFSPTVYEAYNELYPLPPGWRERNLIYQLYHVLNHYYLFGGYYKNQALDIMRRYA